MGLELLFLKFYMHHSSKQILPVYFNISLWLYQIWKQKLCQVHMKVFKNILECYISFIFSQDNILFQGQTACKHSQWDLCLFPYFVASPWKVVRISNLSQNIPLPFLPNFFFSFPFFATSLLSKAKHRLKSSRIFLVPDSLFFHLESSPAMIDPKLYFLLVLRDQNAVAGHYCEAAVLTLYVNAI